MCEDCGLLEDVAALTRAKAHHSVNVPGAISVLAIQGATGVSLRGSAHTHTHTLLVRIRTDIFCNSVRLTFSFASFNSCQVKNKSSNFHDFIRSLNI